MKNKDRILEASLTVVKDQTISGTRMHLIADEAGMLQSNLHYYYKTKNELLGALQEKVLDKCLDLRSEIRKYSDDSLESQLDVFIRQKRAFIREYPEYDFAEMDFWGQGRINPKVKEAFAASFCGWREEIGNILDAYTPNLQEKVRRLLPYLFVSYLEGATLQYLIDEQSVDLDAYFESGKQMFLEVIESHLENKD